LWPVNCIATRSGIPARTRFPNARASKVVRKATRSTSFLACVPPGLREASDSLAFDLLPGPVEHPGAENLFGLRRSSLCAGLDERHEPRNPRAATGGEHGWVEGKKVPRSSSPPSSPGVNLYW
jgi:hypothetical protein